MLKLYLKMLHKNTCNLCCQSNFHHSTIVYQQNYYKILNLKKNCTDRDIRDAFVKLSKECHPDTSKHVNKETTVKFQQILEAYRVLSKPQSRLAYDLNFPTSNQSYANMYTDNRNYYAPFKYHTPSSSNSSSHYYGVRGIKKISNTIIVIGIFCIIGIGVALQLFLIRRLKRNRLSSASDANNEILNKLRANAKLQSKEEHLKRLRDSEKYG